MNCEDYPVVVVDLSSSSKGWGACKYYISALGVGGGSEENAYFAYVVRGAV